MQINFDDYLKFNRSEILLVLNHCYGSLIYEYGITIIDYTINNSIITNISYTEDHELNPKIKTKSVNFNFHEYCNEQKNKNAIIFT